MKQLHPRHTILTRSLPLCILVALTMPSAVNAQTAQLPLVEIIELDPPGKPSTATGPTATEAGGNGVEVRDASATPPPPTAVDETAVRFYARQGDMRRLQAEIDRLRQAHPQWQPPEDLFEPPRPAGPDESPVWALLQQQDFAAARAALAELRRANRDWRPSDQLEAALLLGEVRNRMASASAAGDWPQLLALANSNIGLLSCTNIDLRWLQAEALARTDDKPGSQAAYSRMLVECTDAGQRLSSLQKAATLLDRAALQVLYSQERARPRTEAQDAALQEWWRQYERGGVAEALGRSDATIDASTLDGFAASVADSRDSAGARTLGWYYYNRRTYDQALSWFQRSMEWQESAETAEGLILTHRALRNTRQVNQLLTTWKDRSPGIAKLARDFAPAPVSNQPPADPRGAIIGQAAEALAAEDPASCLRLLHPVSLQAPLPADGLLIHGFCLHGMGRGVESERAFRAVLADPKADAKLRGDAVYGLALRANLSASYTEIKDMVVRYQLPEPRRTEILAAALATLAGQAFALEDYRETLRALDQRSLLVAEPRDLTVNRAWSLFHLGYARPAMQMFKQLDQTFSTPETREGLRVATARVTRSDVLE